MLRHNVGDILEHLQTEQVKAGTFLIIIPHALFQRAQVLIDVPAEFDAVQTRNGCAGAELHHLTIDLDFLRNCHRIEFEGESLYVFDLVAAEVFHERKKKQSDEVMPTETSAENKEEAQPVNTRKGYYPDDIAGSFGVPVEQHRQESEVRQMDGYVSVGMLTGLPGQQQNT